MPIATPYKEHPVSANKVPREDSTIDRDSRSAIDAIAELGAVYTVQQKNH
jgi:hypothetical protein